LFVECLQQLEDGEDLQAITRHSRDKRDSAHEGGYGNPQIAPVNKREDVTVCFLSKLVIRYSQALRLLFAQSRPFQVSRISVFHHPTQNENSPTVTTTDPERFVVIQAQHKPHSKCSAVLRSGKRSLAEYVGDGHG
jgi:hypothetical protein